MKIFCLRLTARPDFIGTYGLRLFLAVSCLLLAVSSAYAVNGTTLDPSRTLFTARQLGMGGVAVAFSDDANGVFSNPAGLTAAQYPQLTGSSRKLFLDETQYSLISWAAPTNYGVFGLGYVGMGTGGAIPTMRDSGTNRIIQNPSLETVGYENSVIALSYSKKFSNVSVGGNYKLFNQSLSGPAADKGNASSLDLGMVYKPFPWLVTGAVLQNVLGGSIKWTSTEDRLGGFYKFGAGAQILGSSGEALREFPQKLLVGFDVGLPNNLLSNNSMVYQAGVEYFPIKGIALRGGYDGSGITMGVGFINAGFRFDYAYTQRPDIPGDTPHYFTLSYVGDRIVSVKRKLKKKESYLVFYGIKDRSITSLETVTISGEARVKRVLDEVTFWTVPGLSATHEAHEVYEFEEILSPVLNGRPIGIGSFETQIALIPGRNIISAIGFTSPEAKMLSAEAKVLRFSPFDDTSMTHWAIEPIALSVTLGLVKGYPNNTFKPQQGISRAELVTLLVRTMNLSIEAPSTQEAPLFSDVPFTSWAYSFVKLGVAKGLSTGYPDGTFKPNKIISRAEGAAVLARYAALPTQEGAVFPDLKEGYWANKFIAAAKTAGLLKYLEGKNFEPNQPLTRAEACEMLYRVAAIQRKVDQFWQTGIISP